MITAIETEFGYEFKNGDKTELKISKNSWKQIHLIGLDKPIMDGKAKIVFRKTNGGISVCKTLNESEFNGVFSDIDWSYIKDWVRHPEKRDELTAEYRKNMRPEEVQKRKLEKFAEQFDPDKPENQKKKDDAYAKIEVVEEGTVGISGDTGNKSGEKILTKEMVDTLTFEELKNKIVKEKYKAPNYAIKNQSIFSEEWRKKHWQLRNMGGKIGLFWDSVSPYAYDYQIVWDIMINMILEEKNENYTHKTYQNVKDQVKCWEEKAIKHNKPDQKALIDVFDDVGLPFD